MRAIPAFGSCILNRYPNIRFGILESGFGWVPFWASRRDDQAIYIGEGAIHAESRFPVEKGPVVE